MYERHQNLKHKLYFEDSVVEEYDDLVYQVQRGKAGVVKALFRELELKPTTELRPTGETIMHVCAEYGQVEMLDHFRGQGGDIYSRNYVSSL